MSKYPKRIADAKADKKGNITAVRLEGNSSFTDIKTAVFMAEHGKVDAVVVRGKGRKKYLRSRPDSKKLNNLKTMAELH